MSQVSIDPPISNFIELLIPFTSSPPAPVLTQLEDQKPTEKKVFEVAEQILGTSSSLFGKPEELSQVKHWVTKCLLDNSPSLLDELDSTIVSSVYFVSNYLTIADLAVFSVVAPLMVKMDLKQRRKYLNLCRFYDHIQHLKPIRNANHLSKFFVDINRHDIIQAEKKPQAQPQAQQNNKNNKNQKQNAEKKPPSQKPTTDTNKKNVQKTNPTDQQQNTKNQQPPKSSQPKQPKATAAPKKGAAEKPLNVSRLDIRVGRIKSCTIHEKAEKLYIEKIDLGETEPRQIVSGLRGFIPLEQMQDRLVLVLCNMKPVTFQGVKSFGMVMAASNGDHSRVELIDPPSDSKVGERVVFEGFDGEPDPVLNPKKKIFEQLKPDLKTNDNCVPCYKGVPFRTSSGTCSVSTLSNCDIS